MYVGGETNPTNPNPVNPSPNPAFSRCGNKKNTFLARNYLGKMWPPHFIIFHCFTVLALGPGFRSIFILLFIVVQ